MKKKIKKNINTRNSCIAKAHFISKLYLPGKKLTEIVLRRISIKVILFNEIFSFSPTWRSLRARMKSLIVLAAFTVICSAKYIVDGKGKLPCEPCDQDEIPLIQFKLLNPVCGPCGEMYGPSFEYCCMCDRKIRRACADAIRKWRMKIHVHKIESEGICFIENVFDLMLQWPIKLFFI